MAEASKQARVLGIFERIAEDYDRANARISLGLHKSWKRMLIRRLSRSVPAGGAVLDLCCGTGDIAIALAKARSDVQVTGLDFSPAMLERAEARGRGLPNLRFQRGDAMALPFPDERFAAAAISFGLRNTADCEQVLREMRRVTRNGGELLCLDSFVPGCALIRPVYRLYFKHLMPLLGGGLRHRREYLWLSESTEAFLSRRELEALFTRCALRGVGSRTRMLGACSLVWGKKIP